MTDQTDTRVPAPDMLTETDLRIAALEKAVAEFKVPESARDSQGQVIEIFGHRATKEFGEVVGAIAAIMADMQPVTKGGENTFHHYKYARMQDILQMLTPLMGKHGVVVFQYESDRNMFDDGKVIAITYRFIVAHKSGQTWVDPVPQTGMSPCRTSKNTFDDKAFAKCHTSARKYFLLSLFQVPTEDENDPDNEKGEKRERSNAPVPSPDGHVAPHLIDPVNRDTFDTWADRYLAAARTSKTLAELDAWDVANDNPLSQMDANDKGKPVYERILREFEVIRAKLQPAPAGAKQDPISTGVQQTVPPVHETVPPVHETVPPVHETAPFVRPEGMPNAEMEPDAFVAWAMKRMDGITGNVELSLVWEQEITPGTDGLFKPDCDALEQHYEARFAKLEG